MTATRRRRRHNTVGAVAMRLHKAVQCLNRLENFLLAYPILMLIRCSTSAAPTVCYNSLLVSRRCRLQLARYVMKSNMVPCWPSPCHLMLAIIAPAEYSPPYKTESKYYLSGLPYAHSQLLPISCSPISNRAAAVSIVCSHQCFH